MINNNDDYQTDVYFTDDVENVRKANKNLLGLIVSDLLHNQKISLLLLAAIIVSAGAVLVTTDQIKKQLFEREQLLLEQGVLESEWRNLVIEENVLADPKRIGDKAREQLGMTYVTPQNETVIVIKSK